MASEKILPSIELSQALGLPVGVPVTPAALEREVKRHTKPAAKPLNQELLQTLKRVVRANANPMGSAGVSDSILKTTATQLVKKGLVVAIGTPRRRSEYGKEVGPFWVHVRPTPQGRELVEQHWPGLIAAETAAKENNERLNKERSERYQTESRERRNREADAMADVLGAMAVEDAKRGK